MKNHLNQLNPIKGLERAVLDSIHYWLENQPINTIAQYGLGHPMVSE